MGPTDNPAGRAARFSVRLCLIAGLAGVLTLGALAGSRPTVVLQTALATGRCHVPRLKGLAVQTARAKAAKAGCRLRMRGAPVKQPVIQTVARQRPRAGRRAKTVTIWVNPACFRSALSGPPAGEPLVTSGPTELVTGLFLEGGPLVPFSSPHCAFAREQPWAGTIEVGDHASGAQIATETVARGQLATFDLAPGTYDISGSFAQAQTNDQPIHARTQTVAVPAGKTVRQDITADVP